MTYTSPAGEKQVLVLQGGGALGAYQAGVCEALGAAGFGPDWVAGISIGGINAALIAGNPPGRRIDRLHEFWDMAAACVPMPAVIASEMLRPWFAEASANWIVAFGVPGFFAPRFPPALLQPPGASGALSFYDTAPLRESLERFVDFDLINSDSVRLSLGATNVRTGNFCYFDNAYQRIGPEHVMASGALPPGFPPVEIEGELYWDGGLVSNTPLQYVLDQETRQDLLVFQVDLFSSHGESPRTLAEVTEREKDIRFSSRTRLNTDMALEMHRAKTLVRELIAEAPPEKQQDPRVRELACLAHENAVTVVHLVFRPAHYRSYTKDYEFSRMTMLDTWQAGIEDVEASLRHQAWLSRSRPASGAAVFDLGRGGPKIVRDTGMDYTPREERAPEGVRRTARRDSSGEARGSQRPSRRASSAWPSAPGASRSK
jgi:NTE family protein